ncbi:MAG: hypothetical protein RJA70_2428 [Pseudomonadota bacterium]
MIDRLFVLNAERATQEAALGRGSKKAALTKAALTKAALTKAATETKPSGGTAAPVAAKRGRKKAGTPDDSGGGQERLF